MAVLDPRAAPLTVWRLLAAQKRWAEGRARKFTKMIGVRADRRVRDLSEEEVERLVVALFLRRVLPREAWYPSRRADQLRDLIRA